MWNSLNQAKFRNLSKALTSISPSVSSEHKFSFEASNGPSGVADEDWLYATTFSVAHLDEVFSGYRIADLQFDGLDTFCIAYLVNVSVQKGYGINNGPERECSTANRQYVPLLQRMFDSPTHPLTLIPTKAILRPQHISQNNDNLLVLRFSSIKKIAKDLEGEYGVVPTASCDFSDPSRVYIRKAQYQWRWDGVRLPEICCHSII